MDVFECIKKRRTVHKYKDEPVSDSDLYKILDAGRWAPSAANRQPVRFIVIKDNNTKQRIYDLVKEVLEMGAEVRERAGATRVQALSPYAQGNINMKVPAMICVVADKFHTDTIYYSQTHHRSAACAAIQNMMLAARALGLGTVWLTFWDPVRIQHLLHIPINYEVVGIIPVGHPVEFPELPLSSVWHHSPARKDITEVAYSEKFGNKYSAPAGMSER